MASNTVIARASLRRAVLSRPAFTLNRALPRHQSTASSGSSHMLSGLAGGAVVLVGGYAFYSFSSAGRLHSTINKRAKEAGQYYDSATKQFQQSKPDANEVVEWLKNTAYSYAAFVPGGRGYVDTAFKDLDAVREKHSDEVDGILRDAYTELQDASKSGLSTDTAQKTIAVLEKLSKRLGSQFGDAFSTILDNHPGLKDKVGGNIDQLKQMGEQYGPEAKKQVDETWDQVKEIMQGGLSASNIDKVRKLVEDKTQKIRQMGDKAWEEGMKQAQPYLEKNPKIKELIENNADALKQGNVMALFGKVKDSVQSGNTGDLEKYINDAKSKVQKLSGGKLDNLFQMVPGGSDILSKLSNLREVAEKHRGEGENLLKETFDEVQKVLTQKSKKAEEIVEKAKRDAQ